MSKAIMLRTPSSQRGRPLLANRSGKRRFSEVAGGTTAECAAICCCCPCTLVNFLVLAVYKLPACLCRRAIKMSRKRQLIKSGLLPLHRRRSSTAREKREAEAEGEAETETERLEKEDNSSGEEDTTEREAAELLEKEMWERFYGTGFWRSPSQRETASNGK